MRLTTIMILVMLAVSSSYGQTPWEVNAGTEIYNPVLSPNGGRLIYFSDDDEVLITCIDVATGAKSWSKPLKEFEQYRVARFVGNDTILIGQENRYEFLSAKDGAMMKSIPIAGESWDDLRWESKADAEQDTLKPYFDSSGLAIFYFDDGMQILDLSTASLIYQTEEVPSALKYYKWESVVMINPVSGADSIYFVDTRSRKLVYKSSKYDNDLNSSIYQPFAVSMSQMLIFNEDNIESIDLTTGKRNALIEVDPDDPEFYSPIIFKNGLYLLVTDEGVHKMYDARDGKLIWETAEGAIPGIVEQMIELPNDQALLMAYEPEGRMKSYKIDTKTGKSLWSNHLFTQDGDFETGHKQNSKVWATIGKIALIALTRMPSPGRWGRGSTGMLEYEPNMFYRSERRQYWRDIARINDMYNSWINTKKESEGYASLLLQNDNQVVFATAGKIYSPADEDSRTYNGEGIVTINLADGKIASHTKCEMLSKSEKSGFNAVQDLSIQTLDSAKVVTGVHDLYVVRLDNIEHFPFGEQTLFFLTAGRNHLIVRANDDNETYNYWRIDVGSVPATKTLLARSSYPNMMFIDSAEVTTMVRVTEEDIAAYPVVAGEVSDASFASPKWKLTEDDLDALDVGDLDEALGPADGLQGIQILGNDVLLLGDDRIGYISADGSCRWSHPWYPSRARTKLNPTAVGNSFIFSTGDVATIIGRNCPSKQIANHRIDASDTHIVISPNGTALIVDTDEGIIRGYALK